LLIVPFAYQSTLCSLLLQFKRVFTLTPKQLEQVPHMLDVRKGGGGGK
jgi:hypothetical protein